MDISHKAVLSPGIRASQQMTGSSVGVGTMVIILGGSAGMGATVRTSDTILPSSMSASSTEPSTFSEGRAFGLNYIMIMLL